MKTKITKAGFLTGSIIAAFLLMISISVTAGTYTSSNSLFQVEELVSPDGDKTFNAKCGGEGTEAKKTDEKTKTGTVSESKKTTEEGKCGEGKCGEGKTTEAKTESKDAKVSSNKKAKTTEGKCGEGKCGEGKCGTD